MYNIAVTISGNVSPQSVSSKHYFSSNQNADFKPYPIKVSFLDHEYELLCSKNVFSNRGIDKGTKVLLDFLNSSRGLKYFECDKELNILDLGCGWGPISIFTQILSNKVHQKIKISAVDVNYHSLELTRINSNKLGFNGIRVELADELLKDGCQYDLILSNPPIRVGKDELHTLMLNWLNKLNTNGVAIIVVQKNLGSDSLLKWLNGLPMFCAKKISSSKGFRIIEISMQN